MKIGANTIRPGNVIEHEGRQFSVLKIQLITPGKGGAFIQVDMRDLKTGTKTNQRWRTADTVEKLSTDQKTANYLFADGDMFTFMEQETYEQFPLTRDVVGEQADFLQDNMEVTIDYVEGTPVAVHLPATVVMTLVEADPVVKGQTAASSYKPAKLENGRRILVPPHIEAGIKVVVNTENGEYVERFKG
ncbi:MAG: elongation factor P [Rhodospirillaceae bacterium]|nr:elongation factor P [Rhodospirillaceae bacterium]